jgi:hypothetical protein
MVKPTSSPAPAWKALPALALGKEHPYQIVYSMRQEPSPL